MRGQTVGRVLHIDEGLLNRALGPTPRPPKKEKPLWGRGHCGTRKVKYPDDLIAHIKWLWAQGGHTQVAIAARYGMHKHYVMNLIGEIVRVNVKPAQSHNPDYQFDRS
jgi:hypothetical protein